MEFDDAYAVLLRDRTSGRSPMAAQRLADGLGKAESLFLRRVWWPAYGHFDNLHPEYEVDDFKDRHRYIDFAYILPAFKIAIEIDGIDSHWRSISQEQFTDHCQRQNDLVIDGWNVLRFTYDQVERNPRACQQTIALLIGKLSGEARGRMEELSVLDRAIIHAATLTDHPLVPEQVARDCRVSQRTASRHLHDLAERDWLKPLSGSRRFSAYRLHPSHDLRNR